MEGRSVLAMDGMPRAQAGYQAEDLQHRPALLVSLLSARPDIPASKRTGHFYFAFTAKMAAKAWRIRLPGLRAILPAYGVWTR